MPLPEEHLRRLDACLRDREGALARIREGEGPAEEALVHETLLVLGRDPLVLWALDDLCEDPSSAQRDGAVAYFNRYGVPIPADADVRFIRLGARVRVEATFVHSGFQYTVAWDRDEGFSVDQRRPVVPSD